MLYNIITEEDIVKLLLDNPKMFLLFKNNIIGNDVFKHIVKCQSIYTFGLHRCNGVSDQDMKHAGFLKRLRQLYFCDVPLTGDCLRYFEYCNDLTILYYIFMRITSQYYPLLARLHHLRELQMYHSHVTGDIIPYLGQCKQLRRVDLNFGNFEGVNGTPFRQLTHLEELSLESMNINDEVLEHIGMLKSLKFLDLSNNNITDKGVKHLQQLFDLDSLGLSMNNITDNSAQLLRDFSKLRSLDLHSSLITDKALHILSEGPVAQSLEYLNISENIGISPGCIEVIFERFPNVSSLSISNSNNMSDVVDIFNRKVRQNGVRLNIDYNHTVYMTTSKYIEKQIMYPEIPDSVPDDLFSIEEE